MKRPRLRNRRNLGRLQVLEPRLLLTAEVEPNNTLGSGTLFGGPSDTLTGRIDNLNDIDYFRILLTSGDSLRFRYTDNDPDGSPAFLPTMEILNSTGEVKASSYDAHTFSYTVATAGTYALRLTANSVFGNVTGEYSIVADVDAFSGTAETESNNTQATASSLTGETNFRGSLATAGDVDFFSFFASAGQAAAVKFTEKLTANPAIRLYSPTGSLLATNRSGQGLFASIAQSGTYTFAIQSDNTAGTVTGAYVGQLLIATEPTLDAEAGNGFESATVLDLGPHVVSSLYLSPDAAFTSRGLTGSYINQNLRGTSSQSNWVGTQPIVGSRIDPQIHFPQNDWGNRAALNLTNGTNDNWDNYSVQWDGFIRIVASGTQVYTASDDGSRAWIDLNGDGVFATSGSELLDNNWGNGQGNTLGPASIALAVGDYRIRIQYEDGNGDNNAYLLWSDAAHSAGVVSRNNHQDGVGSLSSMSDVDVYSVNLTGTGFYEFQLTSSGGTIATQNRLLTLYNEFGQPLESSTSGRIATDRHHTRPEATGRYFVTAQATNETGLGTYELVARIGREFPTYRDIPLFYQDYSGYSKPSQVPEFLAFFESRYDIYQIDLTQSNPGSGSEHVDWTFTNSGTDCGGSAGGWYGTRHVSGGGSGDCGAADWTRLADVWFGLFYHENGHGVGLPHARQPLAVMSYGGHYDYFPVGSYNRIGGDGRISTPKVQNERNYLDWVLESGRIMLEDESNDDLESAQRLNPFFGEMSTDADARNDQVVVVGAVATPMDADMFQFTAANESYAIDVDSAEFQFPLDSQLEILNGSGTVLATNQGAIDRDSGLASVDPYLVYQFATPGDYYVRVSSQLGTVGNYRLKITPERAFDQAGPRVAASWPDGGSSVDGTRQLLFWINDQLDPATLTATNIVVTGESSGTRAGSAVFDPITSTLTWRANTVLPPDTYTITLRGGTGGITDLRGNRLDGETDGILNWPEVSGDGTTGGNFISSFTVTQADTTPAAVYSALYLRHPHDRSMFEMKFDDELDVFDVYSKSFTLRGTGPDDAFGTADDTFSPVDVIYDRIENTADPKLRVYSHGILDPDTYRIEANLLDAAGNTVNLSQTFEVTLTIPTSALFTTPAKTTGGLVGSYINQSLRDYSSQDDWRITQSVAGTRNDLAVGFYNDSFGARNQVGVTGGTDANWDNFSAQWDGVVVIPANGVRLFTRSDDGSRMWIDINGDGNFNSSGSEFVDNNWGTGQGTTTGPASVALNAGTYRIRVQYEEGDGGNNVQLMWDYAGTLSTVDGLKSNPQVVDVNVQPNTVLTSPPASIDVTFSQSITTATITTASFRVRYSPDSTFFDANDTYLTESNGAISWSPTLRKATFQPATILVNGYYLIELDGDAGGITSLAGRLLDGEYRDTNIAGNISQYGWNDSPSGDGLPGGDYRAMFVLSAPQLLVDIPIVSFPENVGSVAAVGTVTRRYTDFRAPLTVSLATSDTTEATVPATVTILAGQASATFNIAAIDDTLLDNTQVVTITASAASFQSGSDVVSVTDIESLAVTINPGTISENGGSATGTVTRSNTNINSALTVTLGSNDTTEATVPATITILANQTSATFAITAADDTLLDGTKTVTIIATATSYVGGSANVNVTDFETLSVTISPASISENGGSSTGTVTRSNSDINSALTVTLSSNDTTEATVPTTIAIPANQASVTFAITAADDALLDGTQTVTISASATNYVVGSANVNVTDVETLTVTISPASISENGGSATGTVTRSNTDIGAELIVTMSSNDTTEATVPATITILPNQASATFAITAADDSLLDGTQTATITATSPGYVAGNAIVDVTDDDNQPPTISDITDQSTSEDTPTAALEFTVGDLETAAGNLTVTASSSNTVLVPNGNLVLGGSGASRTLTINPSANQSGTSTIIVTVTDAGGIATSDTFVLTVNAVDDAPVLGAFDTPVTYTENAPAVLLDTNATVTDIDSANFDTGALTISLISNAESTDRLEIVNEGTSSGQIGVSGTNVTFGGSTIGTFTGGVGTGDLVVAMNVNATPVAVQALLRNVTYRSVSDSPSTAPRTVRASVTDGDGEMSNEPTKTLNVTAVNDAPTALALTATSVAENRPVGTTVGTFGSTDPDSGDTFTYALVTGTGSTNNASFTVSGDLLKTAASFNFEVKSSYAIRVRVTDAGGLTYEKQFTISVTNVNESPTALALSPTSIAENQPTGATVGTFSSTDVDAGDTFSYALVTGTGSTNNASFTVSGNSLKTAAIFNFEVKSSYAIRVRVTDAGGLTYEKQFTISVTNVNESPTALSLTATSIAENQPSGTTVGTLLATDPDAGDTFAYALVAGTGSTDNASFAVSGNSLKSAASFDFENKSSYAIRVEVTDAGGLTYEKQFTIAVTDVIEAPVITGPVAVTPSQRPVISWTAVAGATQYEISVTKEPSASPFLEVILTGTSYTPATDFGIGKFKLLVRAKSNTVVGPWTPQYNFVINTAATFHSIARSQPTLRPTISWNALPGAVKYDVWINDVSRGIFQHIREPNVTGTSFTHSADMPLGLYRAWVAGIAADGTAAAWSTGIEFITMQAPTITQGQNSTFDRTPTFAWNALPGAAKYEVFIRNRNTGATTLNQTNITGLSFTPATPISDGPYRWWAIGVSAQGVRSFWTAPMDIYIGGRTELLTSLGGSGNRVPTFTWRPVDGAVRYDLFVNRDGGPAQIIRQQNLTGTSYTHSSALQTGTYRAWIQAVSSTGELSPWSIEFVFTVVDNAPTDDPNTLAGLPDGMLDLLVGRNRGSDQEKHTTSAPRRFGASRDVTPDDLIPDLNGFNVAALPLVDEEVQSGRIDDEFLVAVFNEILDGTSF